MGFHFQNCKHFLEYFRFFLLTTVYTKKMTLVIFIYLFYFQSYNEKIIFFVFTNSAVKAQHILYTNESFLRKVLVSFFSSNIPLYIEKHPVDKSCKVLEMELKTYTTVSPKFAFEKIKFKVLHYIQHDFIRQCLGLSKDQTSLFKSFVTN